MNILVLIKQVPMSSDIGVDEETGVIKRDSGDSKMNPYDLYGLETAFQLKEEYGGKVSVLTMGPPAAEAVIREAYMMGADEGWLLSDRVFAGSDVLATSAALSGGIQAMENRSPFDLIICGKQTTDGDTGQIASECSEFLQIPCITNVVSIDSIIHDDSISLSSDLGHRIEKVKVPFPAMIAVEKGIYQPRLPSYILKKKSAGYQINWLNQEDLDKTNAALYGLEGSPTQVVRIFPPDSNTEQEIWKGTAEELSSRLFSLLEDEKFLQEGI
ncbi:MAG: electron transfer flavoprotein subunit beta/FixA family protein [Spirochaetales bacterium]|nr:electron transfer flavoprotein subunit beta/FixA family protein [Spirochaetales bacterium]